MPRFTRLFGSSLLLCVACGHSSVPTGGPVSEPPELAKEIDAAPVAAIATGPQRQREVFASSGGEIVMTPLVHGTLLLEFAGKAVYVDPIKDANYEGLPKATAIFLTDIHPDHLDAEAIASLSDSETVIIAPAAVAEALPDSMPLIRIMKNGDVSTSKAMLIPQIPSLGVEAVPMYNKTRGPAPGKLFHDKGRGNGYLLSFGGKRIYISGDTECTDEMKALQDIDVALVCMNLPYTMPPSEAAECISAFQPKRVYPYHYRDSDLTELSAALEGQPIDLRLLDWY